MKLIHQHVLSLLAIIVVHLKYRQLNKSNTMFNGYTNISNAPHLLIIILLKLLIIFNIQITSTHYM